MKYSYKQLMLIGYHQWRLVHDKLLKMDELDCAINESGEDIKESVTREAISLVLAVDENEVPWRELSHDCSACEYVDAHTNESSGVIAGGFTCFKVCPLKNTWPKGCCSEESPYRNYIEVTCEDDEENYDRIQAAEYAQQISDAFKALTEEPCPNTLQV